MKKLYFLLMISIFNVAISMEQKIKSMLNQDYYDNSRIYLTEDMHKNRLTIINDARALMDSNVSKDDPKLISCYVLIAPMDEHSLCFEELLKYGLDPDFEHSILGKVLNRAITEKALNNVRLLLSHGADAEAREKTTFFRNTPLEAALFYITPKADTTVVKIIELLLKHGANPYCTNEDGKNAIEIARNKGLNDIAELMETYSVKNEISK